jgi:hypothetical protein
MQVSTKKITRLQFVDALNTASLVINKLHPNTRLAFYCEKFLELNKKENKAHTKKYKELTADLTLTLDCFRAQHAVEKDGKLLRDKDGQYEFNREGEQAVLKKQIEIQDKIEVVVDELLEEEVLIKCCITEVQLPDGITWDTKSKLNGFAFKNVNEFEESVEVLSEEAAAQN